MKKLTLMSIAVAAILLTGCNEKGKEAASETATKAVEATKTAADATAATAKETANEAQSAVEKAAKSISEATEKAVEATKQAASTVTDSAKEVVKASQETAEKVMESAQEATAETIDKAKEGVAAAATSVAAAVTETTQSAAGADVYKKCAGCHGVDGKTKALGKSAEIAGQSKEDLVTKITEYKAGTRNTAGMGALMKGQVASLSEDDIQAVAQYISTLK